MLDDHKNEFAQAGSAGRVTGHLDDWEDLAVDYMDGQVDPPTKAAIEAHLEGCAACAARLGVQRSVCSLFEQTPLEAPPADLEDQVLGEILFPKEPARAATRSTQTEPSKWSLFWRRDFKAWIPVTVAVVALLAAVVSYGVVRGTSSSGVTTTAVAAADSKSTERNGYGTAAQDTSAAPTTTAAGATTTAGATSTMAASATTTTAGLATGAGPGPAGVSTTAAPTTTTIALPPATTVATIQDKKAMVSQLKSAGSPVYFVFEPAPGFADKGPAEHTSQDFAQQITQLTGLQPLDTSLSLQGTTFAAYVPRNQAAQFVDLLNSIGSALKLTVNLAGSPVDTAQPETSDQFSARLREHAAQIPEMHAARTPQPAVSDWTFTTSTLLPPDKSATPPPDWQAPDADGTHVLVIIYLGV